MKGNVKWDTEARLAPQTICTSFDMLYVQLLAQQEDNTFSHRISEWIILNSQ